ncbi:YusW family protein [Planococcus donghaensis]|uniref:YusW-like protein n=1 Tax=Planococcus donghaensis TaxID=414778 RepID=A0A1C7EID2_9BACL|nr:YusW family protein [Planococcus donghaensis]ANU23112.1 hypothetical protein BCM40_06915 [Planococcus donghaensis]
MIRKNAIATGLLFSAVFSLGACGNDDQVTDTVTEDAVDYEGVVDANPGGGLEDENIGGKVYGFTEFELEVEYTDPEEKLKVSYEEDRDLVEAEYENSSAEEMLSGNNAFDKIEPFLAQLELTPDMSDEDVISKVTEVFDIAPDYESIEIDVTYADGTDKEYESSGN